MSRVYFQNVIIPCLDDMTIRWHIVHGWVWDIYEVPLQRKIGVFYATLLCEDAVIIHFDTRRDITISPATTLSALRRGVALAAANSNAVFATVPEKKSKLIRCLCRLGFIICREASYWRDDEFILLLKYLPPAKCYCNSIEQP